MAHLQIRSTSPLNLFRRVHIFIDGQKKCSVAYGQLGMLELPPGEHDIQARIDWCGSTTMPLQIGAAELVDVEVTGFQHSDWIVPVSGLFSVINTVFGHDLGIPPWLAFILLAPGAFLLLYHITFGRWAYLRLAVT